MIAKEHKKRLVLLDAHAILHRAYHALPDFSSSSGEPTGALYGLSAMLLKILDELKPDYVAACFDVAKPTYRHDAFEHYKAGRSKTDEELVVQIKRSYDVFRAFGIPIYEKEGFEADDILGTIVENLKKEKGVEIIIATGDMDTLQLVDNKKVRVYTLRKGIKDTVLYDEEAVNERYGFGPEHVADYKGLCGDPSDNIPGVKGVGAKTATSLIQTFGAIEDMYKGLEKDKEAFKKKAGVTERVANLLLEHKEEAEFSKMLGQIHCDVPIKFFLPDRTWRESLDFRKITALFQELSFRTLALRAREVLGVQEEEEESTQKAREDVQPEELREVGIALWLLDSSISNPTTEDILSYGKTESFKAAKEKILKDLKAKGLESVYRDIEIPLIPVIERMEERGIKIDKSFLKKLSKEYHLELEKLEKKIYKLSGEEFNINSPKQLGDILYGKLLLGGSKVKKTSTGAKSTRESELVKLSGEHEIIELILDYRELQKLLTTYIDNLPAQVSSDGRLHANFMQTGTTTGRMSSQSPNLQNIPIKTDRGRKIREAFIAEKGFKLVAFDYSQIELRVAAMLSGDKSLSDIFINERDVHTEVACKVFGVEPDEVTKQMRARAKAINFGILYGMGVNALSKNLETGRKEAQKYLTEYFNTFSGLTSYIESAKKKARQAGYVETYFGRKRFLEGIASSLPFIRAEAERQAVNAPLQGTQADIIKIAMAQIDGMLEKKGLSDEVYLLLQVHDELVFEIKDKRVREVAPEIERIMENVLPRDKTGGIKFEVNVEAGNNWGETKPLENS